MLTLAYRLPILSNFLRTVLQSKTPHPASFLPSLLHTGQPCPLSGTLRLLRTLCLCLHSCWPSQSPALGTRSWEDPDLTLHRRCWMVEPSLLDSLKEACSGLAGGAWVQGLVLLNSTRTWASSPWVLGAWLIFTAQLTIWDE